MNENMNWRSYKENEVGNANYQTGEEESGATQWVKPKTVAPAMESDHSSLRAQIQRLTAQNQSFEIQLEMLQQHLVQKIEKHHVEIDHLKEMHEQEKLCKQHILDQKDESDALRREQKLRELTWKQQEQTVHRVTEVLELTQGVVDELDAIKGSLQEKMNILLNEKENKLHDVPSEEIPKQVDSLLREMISCVSEEYYHSELDGIAKERSQLLTQIYDYQQMMNQRSQYEADLRSYMDMESAAMQQQVQVLQSELGDLQERMKADTVDHEESMLLLTRELNASRSKTSTKQVSSFPTRTKIYSLQKQLSCLKDLHGKIRAFTESLLQEHYSRFIHAMQKWKEVLNQKQITQRHDFLTLINERKESENNLLKQIEQRDVQIAQLRDEVTKYEKDAASLRDQNHAYQQQLQQHEEVLSRVAVVDMDIVGDAASMVKCDSRQRLESTTSEHKLLDLFGESSCSTTENVESHISTQHVQVSHDDFKQQYCNQQQIIEDQNIRIESQQDQIKQLRAYVVRILSLQSEEI